MNNVEQLSVIRSSLEWADLVYLPVARLIELGAIMESAEQFHGFQCVIITNHCNQISFVDSIFTDKQIKDILFYKGLVIPSSEWEGCKILAESVIAGELDMYEVQRNMDGQIDLYKGKRTYYNHGRDVEIGDYKLYISNLSEYQLKVFNLMKGRK